MRKGIVEAPYKTTHQQMYLHPMRDELLRKTNQDDHIIPPRPADVFIVGSTRITANDNKEDEKSADRLNSAIDVFDTRGIVIRFNDYFSWAYVGSNRSGCFRTMEEDAVGFGDGNGEAHLCVGIREIINNNRAQMNVKR